MTIVYLANAFPEWSEPYVWEEICEIRAQKQTVLACSIKRPRHPSDSEAASQTLYALPLRRGGCLVAMWACVRQFPAIKDLLWRAICGPEPLTRRLHTLFHTWLGVYLGTLLREKHAQHIHVHHGYFASWAGMVAARILGAGFSMTLHGSDLLVRHDYLETKLQNCRFCITVSDFNRQHILRNHPAIDPDKILLLRLGVDTFRWRKARAGPQGVRPLILSVGRLTAIKNQSFLILACRLLQSSGVQFRCVIIGDGEERPRLEQLIRALGVEHEVKLLGQVPRDELAQWYTQAEVVVLTSRSEGIPMTLMEAMAMRTLVLAPEITGIPELIEDGKSGFLYQANSMEDFLHKLQFVLHAGGSLNRIREAARRKVERKFNSALNLPAFAQNFLERVGANRKLVLTAAERETHEDSLLQQVQLSVQRD